MMQCISFNNNNEYLECLTRTGPKRLHVLYKYIYCQNSVHTTWMYTYTYMHTQTRKCMHVHTQICTKNTHTHTHTHQTRIRAMRLKKRFLKRESILDGICYDAVFWPTHLQKYDHNLRLSVRHRTDTVTGILADVTASTCVCSMAPHRQSAWNAVRSVQLSLPTLCVRICSCVRACVCVPACLWERE